MTLLRVYPPVSQNLSIYTSIFFYKLDINEKLTSCSILQSGFSQKNAEVKTIFIPDATISLAKISTLSLNVRVKTELLFLT
ncbi:hypothetical protein NIES2100_52810 [Calothrix sp. NIES-2100]|nr:hypothetical protein NIES2100_52810 [Calothrix sp. NIES-2100]